MLWNKDESKSIEIDKCVVGVANRQDQVDRMQQLLPVR